MKKNILIALFALLAVALNSNAQNNTYNMVIEMANGTKITIGPNDVKNISFNNGELVITGENINTLVEQQSKADERIDSLATTNQAQLNALWAHLSTIQYELANRFYNKEEIDALLAKIQGGSTPDLSNYATKADLQAIIERIDAIPSCQCDWSGLEKRWQTVEAMIANIQGSGSTPDLSDYVTQAQLQEMKSDILDLTTWVNSMSLAIENLNQKVDALNTKVDAIQ